MDEKKRPHKAGVKLLRQVSYRQETYRAVLLLYATTRRGPSQKFEKATLHGYAACKEAGSRGLLSKWEKYSRAR